MHIPVLLNETIEGLNIIKGGVYVDCTVNLAGHSELIATQIGKEGTLICIDLDKDSLDKAKEKLEKLKDCPKLYFIQSNFRYLKDILKSLNILSVDGVMADLGISSNELDVSGRGFTFRFDEPLLMTFDAYPNEETLTAKDIVNCWSEETLADIFFGFSDEKYSRRIAQAIIKARAREEIKTTFQLVNIVSSAVPTAYRYRKTHFATKTFQALRMAVNEELESITDLISSFPEILKSGDRACIITFHSTEDRLVKKLFRENNLLKIINKKVIVESEEILKTNNRSRSAQLRIVEKI